MSSFESAKSYRKLPIHIGSALILIYLAFLALCLVYPFISLGQKSFLNDFDEFIGLENFKIYFSTPGLVGAFWRTLAMGFSVTIITVCMAFFIAYGFTHTRFPGRGLCRNLSLIPLFTPSVFPAIGLIYLLGNQGLLRGYIPIQLYGSTGIILACVIYTLPHAVILLSATLRDIDQGLYHAARALGASPLRCFLTVTLPGARYGLTSAAIVVFILTITDFGIPKVLGGDFSVLSTEIFKQVIGMQNFSMGATVSLILLLPAIPALILDRWARKKQTKGYAAPLNPQKKSLRDTIFLGLSLIILSLPLAVTGLVIWGSFISFWPYDFSFTLANFEFKDSVYGIAPLGNSLKLAIATSIGGIFIIFTGAYIVERCQRSPFLATLYRVAAILPLGIPGTVLGLSYILAFNIPSSGLSFSPLTWMNTIYGSIFFLAINCIIHFYTVCHFTVAGGLARLSPSYELAGKTLGVSRIYTFGRVIVPMQKESIMDIGFYLFVNAMTTISAVVFLYSPESIPASVAILQLLDSGRMAEASAMGSLLLSMALGARVLQLILHNIYLEKQKR